MAANTPPGHSLKTCPSCGNQELIPEDDKTDNCAECGSIMPKY